MLLNLVLNLVLEYSNLVVTVLIRTVMTQSLSKSHTKYSKHDKSQQLANFIELRHYDKQNNAALAVLDRSMPNRR